jgi:Zn-dependent peptidase ImmA (M78 family)
MYNNIKYLLREELQMMPKREIVGKFIDFVKDNLGITNYFKVNLTNDKNGIRTTAVYSHNGNMVIYIKNRAMVDILRSIAHEMVHHKQNEDGLLTGDPSEGSDGSEIENEANAKAGELIRIFGRQNPEIYTT